MNLLHKAPIPALRHVRISQIFVREGHNPRTDYGQADGSLAELVASIKEQGMLHPPLLRAADDSRWRYYIVAGHRRIAAAKHLGMVDLPCFCLDHKSPDVAAREDLVLAMVENLQRKDLSPIEQAQGFQRLLDTGLTQVEVARLAHVSQPVVCNTLALLKLPESVQRDMAEGKLGRSSGEELLPLVRRGVPAAKIEQVAKQAAGKTSREIRDAVAACAPTPKRGGTPPSSTQPARYDGMTEEQLVRWATKKFGSVPAALAELNRLVGGSL